MQPSFPKNPIKVWKHRGVWPNEEPALRLPESRDRIITVKEAKMRWSDMNAGTKPRQGGRGETPKMNAFALINKSLSAYSELKHLTNLEQPWFPPYCCRAKHCLSFERPCVLWVALCLFIVSECRGLLHSGSPSGSRVGAPKGRPHPPPRLSAEVKMDEMATLMNAWSDRWMNGVTWSLDNRNCPQDWRSKW